MFDDFKKFDKEFNESMNISLEGNKKKKKFPNPKPRYTKLPQTRQTKPGKNKPIMTKENQEQAKNFIKSTGSAFGSILSKMKNRKIIKLEKEHFKQKEKAEALAHEIKLRLSIQDSNVDISRYEKELELINKPKEKEHSQACKDFNLVFEQQQHNNRSGIILKCICGNDED